MASLTRARDLLGTLKIAPSIAAAEYYKTVGASAFWLGQIAFDAGNFDDAARWMKQYESACVQWQAAVPTDVEAKTELSFALGSLGAIALRRADWTEAKRAFRQALVFQSAQLEQALLSS